MKSRRRSWVTRAATASAVGGVRRPPHRSWLPNTPQYIIRSPAHNGDHRSPAAASLGNAPTRVTCRLAGYITGLRRATTEEATPVNSGGVAIAKTGADLVTGGSGE